MAVGLASLGFGQSRIGVTHSGQTTGQPPHPITAYSELPNPIPTNPEDWSAVMGVKVSWGSTDLRYRKELPAPIDRANTQLELTAWRGEKVSGQWVIWGDRALSKLSVSVSDLTCGGERILSRDIQTGFVRYVMTDELNKDGKGGCGHRPDPTAFDSTLVADPIDHLTQELRLDRYTTQGGWISIQVPGTTKPGTYRGAVVIHDGPKTLGRLALTVHVKDRLLPPPSEWSFHLDLWQNPFAIARYHGVRPWSEEHMECMRPYMEMYRDAGGKVITTSIVHKPWNGQTFDYFESMVKWIKKKDGSWDFDYTIFDQWVEYMMDIGITKEINCYSMVPWHLSFQYFDEATKGIHEIQTEPGEVAYNEMWGAMLKSFAAHLREKGWFSITHISMDERPAAVMKTTLGIIRAADPEFKVSLAGALHEELSEELNDYCVALRMKYPEEMKAKRKAEGKTTTFYTSCEEPRPNTFTFCPPAESEWFGWYAARENLDGYLRWALNSWVIEPLLDSRFYTWAAGDTYLIYPGARSSLRYERLISGIQAFEKIRILKQVYAPKDLNKLDKALQAFDETTLDSIPAAEVVRQANEVLNSY